MVKLTIRPIEDKALISKVLCDPEIFECINDDTCLNVDDFDIPIDDNIEYIAGFVGSDIIGLMIYHKLKGGTKCHIQVLPKYRNEHARKFARMALNIGKAKNAHIYSEIPTCYQNVLAFAKEFGFKESGNIKDGYTKNGISHDVIIMRA